MQKELGFKFGAKCSAAYQEHGLNSERTHPSKPDNTFQVLIMSCWKSEVWKTLIDLGENVTPL